MLAPSASPARTAWPAAHFDRNKVPRISETGHYRTLGDNSTKRSARARTIWEPYSCVLEFSTSWVLKSLMLEIQELEVAYGSIIALHRITLSVAAGKIITLVGSNGAGKSTTLRAISGLIRARQGKIIFEGEEITNRAPHRIVAMGITQVPEGRMIFSNLTVLENLQMGAYRRTGTTEIKKDYDYMFAFFPRLKEREKQVAGTLSGGEQQMLAIARALMSKPRFLMLDEPSLGIAPILVKTIFSKIVEINQQLGITILLVEQNANLALEISDYGYVLETGRIILKDESVKLRANSLVKEAYLGG
jgi:branched-chain amino acid transport system ATP-binding protein